MNTLSSLNVGTSIALSRVPAAVPRRALVPALARQEARRLLLHPLALFGFALYVINAVRAIIAEGGPRESFETVDSMLSFFPGIFLILAANLVATRDRRADSDEMLDPLPGRPSDRTKALILASFAPAVVGLALMLSLHSYFLLDDRYVTSPGVWHLLQGPTTLVGASLLGIMVARWVPARSAALLVVVAMVTGNAWLNTLEDGMLFGPLMTWPVWGILKQDWAGVFPGSPMWHVVYLVGLCGMAGAAAMLRVAGRRTPTVVAGVLAVAVALLGGWAQLP